MFNLTRVEIFIIIFLLSAMILGCGIMVYRRISSPLEIRRDGFSIEAGKPVFREGKKVNINKADAGELMRLKGVGKVLAERIAAYRASKGTFADLEEIKKVKGIGKVIFEKIKGDIYLE